MCVSLSVSVEHYVFALLIARFRPRRVLDDGLRTADLARENTIGCRQMGEEVAKRI